MTRTYSQWPSCSLLCWCYCLALLNCFIGIPLKCFHLNWIGSPFLFLLEAYSLFWYNASFPITIISSHGNISEFFNRPLEKEHKLNIPNKFRRHPGRLLNILCTLYLNPMSRGCRVSSLTYQLNYLELTRTRLSFLYMEQSIQEWTK